MKSKPTKKSATDPRTPAPGSFIGWLRLGLQAEFALFRRPMLVLSVLAIVVVPSLYAVFYISSFWDPYGHLDRLPAALVNADQGAQVAGRTVNLGNEIVTGFETNPPFHFIQLPDAAAADAALHRGEVYFTLVIPSDFSERALAARKDEPAVLSLQTAEGVSYTSAIISKRFGGELAHLLNERLNRERWAAVVGDPSAPANESLRFVIGELQDGSHQVQAGAQRLQAGSDQLDQGLGRVADGLQQMNDRLPTGSQLQALAEGSQSADAGEKKLTTGLDQLVAGGQHLEQGAGQLRQGAAGIPFWGGRLTDGATQLQNGLANFDTNLSVAAAGSHELQTGVDRLNSGIQPLTAGLGQLETGLQTMLVQFSPTADPAGISEPTNQSVRLREGSRQLVEGSKELTAGTAKLADGLDRLNASLTANLANADAEGLAGPVQVAIQSYAPVMNNGAAYGPYFASLALWLGGIMITFVFHCRRLIEPMRVAPRWIRWSAKSVVPLCIGILQATVIVAVLRLALGIVFIHPWLAWLAAVLGSITFVSLVLLLIALLGDAGRMVAVVLLILQLAAAGGIYPVELSGPFYETIHPYLPLTALVNAFRAAMFGAFDGSWGQPALQLALTFGGAVALGILIARWKYVAREAYCPAVEFH